MLRLAASAMHALLTTFSKKNLAESQGEIVVGSLKILGVDTLDLPKAHIRAKCSRQGVAAAPTAELPVVVRQSSERSTGCDSHTHAHVQDRVCRAGL